MAQSSNNAPKLRQRIKDRPVLFGSLAVAGLAGLVVVLVWFQPQTLFLDQVVDEEFPAAETAGLPRSEEATPDDETPAGEPGTTMTESEDQAPGQPEGPIALASGSFESRSRYTVGGTAIVYQLEDGSHVLRLEDFSSTNGPDLFVYLTAANSADSDGDLDQDFINLGVLKGNVGNQNYEIPDGVDLDHFDTVVVWCRRFTVGFGAADLIPVA